MANIGNIIARCRDADEELVGLDHACGQTPLRAPPSAAAIAKVRTGVGAALGLSATEAELHHEASQWRYKIVQALTEQVNDSDKALGTWLERGAPMGIHDEIDPGGWFPVQEHGAYLTVDELATFANYKGNHPSFDDCHDEETAPTVQLVQDHLNKGFGMLFASREDAES